MDFLYQLQLFRENAPQFLTTFLMLISHMAYYGGPVAMIIVFLGIDKKFGYELVFLVTSSNLSCNVIKAGFMVERPWILDKRLHVAQIAKDSATGYSFPSAHASMAASFYGSIALKIRKMIISVAMILMILLTLLSRLYLGAHSPQDVVIGMLQAIVVMAVTYFMLGVVRRNPKLDVAVLVFTIVLSVILTIFIYKRPYILGSEQMENTLKDGMGAVGMFSGAVIAWFVEKRFIQFENAKTMKERILRVIGGVAAFALHYAFLAKKLYGNMNIGVYSFLRFFIAMLIVIDLVPLVIKVLQKKKEKV